MVFFLNAELSYEIGQSTDLIRLIEENLLSTDGAFLIWFLSFVVSIPE